MNRAEKERGCDITCILTVVDPLKRENAKILLAFDSPDYDSGAIRNSRKRFLAGVFPEHKNLQRKQILAPPQKLHKDFQGVGNFRQVLCNFET